MEVALVIIALVGVAWVFDATLEQQLLMIFWAVMGGLVGFYKPYKRFRWPRQKNSGN